MSQIEWIVFDLGGVLIRYDDQHHGYKVLAELLGISVEEALRLKESDASILKELTVGVREPDELHALFGNRYAKELSLDQVLNFLNGGLGESIHETVDVLKKLKSRYKTACLSNTCSPHWEWMLTRCEFMQLLDVRMASQEMGVAKPDVRIYEKATEILKTEPGKCLFFDDREENVEAAQLAGWKAYRVFGPESVREGLKKEEITVSD